MVGSRSLAAAWSPRQMAPEEGHGKNSSSRCYLPAQTRLWSVVTRLVARTAQRHARRSSVDRYTTCPGPFRPRCCLPLGGRERSGHADHAYSILGLMSIELWCQAFVDAGGLGTTMAPDE